MKNKIAIIGGGNLGRAICKGFIKAGIDPKTIFISRRRHHLLSDLQKLGVQTSNSNSETANNAVILIIAVKPYKIDEVLREINQAIQKNQIVISTVSGVSAMHILNNLNNKPPVYRMMPNTAISINASMTCISSTNSNNVNDEKVISLFSKLGKAIFVDEEMMDASTVLAACGIAYVMRFIRAMVQGGIEIGFSAETASFIANQTVKGAADLLIENNTHPEQEIDKVTTPKGYTIAGLNEMEHNGFSSSLIKGILTSYQKIEDKNAKN